MTYVTYQMLHVMGHLTNVTGIGYCAMQDMTCDVSNMTYEICHMTCDMCYLTYDTMWHVTSYMSHSTFGIKHVTWDMRHVGKNYFCQKIQTSLFLPYLSNWKTKKILKIGMHWLGPGFKSVINENLTKLRKHKIFFVISTLILWLTHKQLSCFRHYFKGAINALKKLRKSWNRDGLYRLRFILPCKSDCQPIFLKKQGIYSFYAKLWLVRPLIKNIPGSSHWYLSNVTFGASLAF